jgi:hypothetical protein
VVDPDPIGELDLLDRFLNQPEFRVFFPGSRKLKLVENPKSHLALLYLYELTRRRN